MEVTDETLDDDDHNTIELVMPDAELFDHLGLDDNDRRTSKEARIEAIGEDPHELSDEARERSRQLDDDYPTQTPPEPHEKRKCDHCGADNDSLLGQRVRDRGTSLLTTEVQPEYLCPHCYAQVVSQYVGLDVFPALVLVLLSDGHAPWRIVEHTDTDFETTRDVIISVLAEYDTAKDAVEYLHEDEQEFLADREERLVELFPNLERRLWPMEPVDIEELEITRDGYDELTAV